MRRTLTPHPRPHPNPNPNPNPNARQGVGPTAGRATVLAAAELASYDEAKGVLSGFGMSGIVLVACTSFISGFISTVRDIGEM